MVFHSIRFSLNEISIWFDFINRHEPLEKPYLPKLSDLWTIIFTLGTTFNPKGVELPYQALD